VASNFTNALILTSETTMQLQYKTLSKRQKQIITMLFDILKIGFNRAQVAMIGQTPQTRLKIAHEYTKVYVIDALHFNPFIPELKLDDKEYIEFNALIAREQRNEEFWQYLHDIIVQALTWNFDENIVKNSFKKQLLTIAYVDPKLTILQHFEYLINRNCRDFDAIDPNYITTHVDSVQSIKKYFEEQSVITFNPDSRRLFTNLKLSIMTSSVLGAGWLWYTEILSLPSTLLSTAITLYIEDSWLTAKFSKIIENKLEVFQLKLNNLVQDFLQSIIFYPIKVYEPTLTATTLETAPLFLYSRFIPQTTEDDHPVLDLQEDTDLSAAFSQKSKKHKHITSVPFPLKPTHHSETKIIKWANGLYYDPIDQNCKVKPQRRQNVSYGKFFSFFDSNALEKQEITKFQLQTYKNIVDVGMVSSQKGNKAIKPLRKKSNIFFRSAMTGKVEKMSSKLKDPSKNGRIAGRQIKNETGEILEIFDTWIGKAHKK
jgi:hypothetical protein